VRTITLPAGIEYLYLAEVAELIAFALWPDSEKNYKSALEFLKPELEQAAIDGSLVTKNPLTWQTVLPVRPTDDSLNGLFSTVYSPPPDLRIVTVPDLTAYLIARDITVVLVAPEQTPQPQETATNESIDFAMLATRAQLISAFGAFTGMDDSWFTNLRDTPKLKDARRVEGSGGKDSTEPLFCPYAVMGWLIDPKRKKGRPLSEETGWRMLKVHFNSVYDVFSVGRDNTD
jgi:hypothetical protein